MAGHTPFGPPGPSGASIGINHATQPIEVGGYRSALAGTLDTDAVGVIANNFRALLGPDVNISYNANAGEYSVFKGLPHSSQGIPLIVSGRADVISSDILAWTSEAQDPIRVVYGFRVTNKLLTVMSDREIRGTPAIIAPERALAKTISITYNSRKVRMKRLAIDFTMNTNAFQEMATAIDEIAFKMKGVKLSMEQTIFHLAYKELLTHGVKIDDALRRASPVNQRLTAEQQLRRADNVYATSICGALHDRYGITNLLMSVRKANVYTPTGESRHPMQVAILPNMIGAVEYAKPEKMNFYTSGIADDKLALPTELETTAYTSADWGGVRVIPYTPTPGISRGSAHTDVNIHELARPIAFGTYYIEKAPGVAPSRALADDTADCMPCVVTDFVERDWARLPRAAVRLLPGAGRSTFTGPGATVPKKDCNKSLNDMLDSNTDVGLITQLTTLCFWWARPRMEVYAESGFMVTEPGASTAELLYAFPKTTVSNSETVDEARGMVRSWVGPVIKKPQNILVLRDIAFKGILSGAGSRILTGGKYDKTKHDLVLFATKLPPSDPEMYRSQEFKDQCKDYGIYTAWYKPNDKKAKVTEPLILYRGTQRNAHTKDIRCSNNGHLGKADHPDNVGVVEGTQTYIDSWDAFK